MSLVWVCQRPCGDVTLHRRGPAPRCKGDDLRSTLYNGEEAIELVSADGTVRSVWFEAVIND